MKVWGILTLLMLPACHDPAKDAAAAEAQEVVGGDEAADGKGYFVTLASKPSAPEAQKIYDKLYDALDQRSRKMAKAGAADALDAYLEEFQATGLTKLAAGDDEIECDRDKCLFKLHARRIDKQKADAKNPPFAQQLFEALLDANVAAKAGTSGDDFLKTVGLGEAKDVRVACSERRTAAGVPVDYGCLFDLDGLRGDAVAKSALDKRERGKLASCVLSPGVVKAADEAKAAVEGGGLLPLTSAPDATKPFGFLRYTRSGGTIELLDLYLCGDLSTDTFYLVGAGKQPREWVAGMQRSSPGASGADFVDIEPAHHDEGDLTMRARVVAQTSKDMTLSVQFKIVKDASAEVYGEDKFYVKLDKAWLGK